MNDELDLLIKSLETRFHPQHVPTVEAQFPPESNTCTVGCTRQLCPESNHCTSHCTITCTHGC
ncbi:hypothetical protein [Nonomuraea endophytica]|uniref:hypothetical protein n=1 Tax=Nonomuraea endophytica TaxID=714136 RepID=UPI0037CA7253